MGGAAPKGRRRICHAGNADGVRQELAVEIGFAVSLRPVERAVGPFRGEIAAAARATARFETPPGRQLQIDFGARCVMMAGRSERTHLVVATLGYCRRGFVRAFKSQRQCAWFEGIEGAFADFGGVPEEVLLHNAKPLVTLHDVAPREVVFNDRLHAFARDWGFRPVACARRRARTKGKDERGVGYVRKNAIAGRSFESWAELKAHLDDWTRAISDRRFHSATGEAGEVEPYSIKEMFLDFGGLSGDRGHPRQAYREAHSRDCEDPDLRERRSHQNHCEGREGHSRRQRR